MIRLDQNPPNPCLKQPDLSEAYAAFYALVEADVEDHYLFTSGAEAVNQVIMGTYIDVTRKTGRHHFLASTVGEAPSVMAMTRLEEMGCHFQMVPVNSEGIVTPQALAETLTPRTALLSLSWGNGLTGIVQPIEQIAKLCEERGILLHVDATHVLGKGYFLFKESGIHFLTFSGGLFVRKDVELSPLILGGESVDATAVLERGFEAKRMREQTDHFCMEVAHLRAQFEARIVEALPDTVVFGKQSPRLPHISAMGFPKVTSDALFYLLARKKVFASIGGGSYQQIMHVLKASGVSSPLCHCGLSFALSEQTTEEQLEMAATQVVEAVKQLKRYGEHLDES